VVSVAGSPNEILQPIRNSAAEVDGWKPASVRFCWRLLKNSVEKVLSA
jgi:hypothetical protein